MILGDSDHSCLMLFFRGSSSNSLEMLPPDKYAKDVAFLDSYAQERWEVSAADLRCMFSMLNLAVDIFIQFELYYYVLGVHGSLVVTFVRR